MEEIHPIEEQTKGDIQEDFDKEIQVITEKIKDCNDKLKACEKQKYYEIRGYEEQIKELKKRKFLVENARHKKQYDAFRQKMAEKYGMTGHPKEEKVWNMAWEEGHSNGYTEVELHYQDFAELAK